MLRQLTAAIVLAMTVHSADAQILQATRSHYSTDDGLCSNIIQNIYQDDYGYIWLATWNGLSRFDGYNFYNYKTGNGSGIKNLHNRIQSLAIDQSQNVWMRMYDDRLFVLNRLTDMITNPFESHANSDDFHMSGPLLVTSSGEVLACIKNTGLFILQLDKKGLRSELVPDDSLSITSMAEGYQSDIWLGTNNGIHRLDRRNLTVEKKTILPQEHVIAMHSNGYNIYVATKSGAIYSIAYGQEPKLIRKPQGESLFSVFVDSHGLIWTNDNRMGAICIDPTTGSERLFSHTVPAPEHDGRAAIFSESNGVVWVRMNHGGFGYYNREAGTVEYFHNDPINPWNLSNTVHATLALQDGIVWESTSRRGLEKLEILKKNILHEKLIPNATSNLENEVRALYYDPQKKLLLIGNKASSLFLIDGNGQRTIITHDSDGNPFRRIYGIAKGSNGSYWLCSKDVGIFHMTPNGNGWTIKNYHHEDGKENAMNHNGAYQAVEDKQGNLWIATYGGGVNLMTKDAKGQPRFYSPNNGMPDYPKSAYRKVRTIETDKDGNVWAGTTDGILIMSYKNGKVNVEKLKMPEKGDQMLMSNDVVCLRCDGNGTMWVGTNGGGLGCTIGKEDDGTWLFENYDAKDGLPSEEIRSIIFDQHGNAWFATEHNICSFDISKKIFTTFSNLDGVDETSMSEGGATTAHNGELLFGTIDGYYVVNQKNLMASSGSLLKLQITNFYIDGEVQSPRLNNTFDYYVPLSKSVELPNGNNFAFQFAALNYQLQHRIHYQYMLAGYDKDWQNADKSLIASYDDVPGGTYTFKVKAFLLESPDKYDIRTIEVTIPTFFLFSQAALWIYLLLAILLAGYLLYRYRYKKK